MKRVNSLFWVLLLSAFGMALHAQQTVNGSVTDKGGEPLIGASIFVEGTTSGTVTDLNGDFTLDVPANAESFLVSYTGFESQQIFLTGQTSFSIILEEGDAILDEVVVTGYGTATRRRLTTSVASIGTEAYDAITVSSFENALQGRLPGVVLTSNAGTLGAQTGIRVRGVGSINSDNQPLFVVDGVILESNTEGFAFGGPGTNPLVNLNPADIESIDVLKDAASAAIYGSRGSNGVILITTKSGKFNSEARITLNHQVGITDPTALPELMTGPEYAAYWNQAENARARIDPTYTPNLYADPASEPDADYLGLVTQQGLVNETNAGVSGGTSNLAYYIGGTYRDEDGWVRNTNLKKYSLRLNLTARFGDQWSAGLNLNPTRTLNRRQNEDNNVASPFTYATLMSPNTNPRDENGNPVALAPTSIGTLRFPGTPLSNIEGQELTLTTNQMLGSAFVEFRPISNVSIRSQFGTQLLTLNDFSRSSVTTTDGFGSDGVASAQYQEVLNYTWDNTITWLAQVGSSSELDLTAGFSVQNNRQKTLDVSGNTFADDRLQTLNSSAEITDGGGFNTQYRFVGYFARALYSINNRLFLNATARIDGSSRFGSDNYYGFFPA
ncbi:MAG: SusC/RagA family TonB-linked outer membrane protein, partial [Bacteroidota bacterium]